MPGPRSFVKNLVLSSRTVRPTSVPGRLGAAIDALHGQDPSLTKRDALMEQRRTLAKRDALMAQRPGNQARAARAIGQAAVDSDAGAMGTVRRGRRR